MAKQTETTRFSSTQLHRVNSSTRVAFESSTEPSAVRYRCQRYRRLFAPELLLVLSKVVRGPFLRSSSSILRLVRLPLLRYRPQCPGPRLHLTIPLFVFSCELLCLRKLHRPSDGRLSTSSWSSCPCFAPARALLRRKSSIYLVFPTAARETRAGKMLNYRELADR